jgi:hypothetical protein
MQAYRLNFLHFLCFLFFLGCVNEPPQETSAIQQPLDPIAHSGSQIEIRTDFLTGTFDDGSVYTTRSGAYFYDTVINHECEMFAVSDIGGKCLPTSDATIDGIYPGNRNPPMLNPGSYFDFGYHVFSDSRCTQMVATFLDPKHIADATKFYTREYGKTDIYELGRELLPSAVLYYTQTPSATCMPNPFKPGRLFRLFEVVSSSITPVPYLFTRGISVLK